MNRKFFAVMILLSFSLIKAEEQKSETNKEESPIKIRVIEGARIVRETAEGKDIESKLMQERNKLDKAIKTIDQEIEKDIADWQGKARLKVDAESLEKKQRDILQKKKERDVKAEAAQEDFTRAFNRELSKFNSKIKDTVTELAKEEGWDLVKIKETGEIVYASNRVDATDKIIRKHDTKYKAKKAEEAKAKQAAVAPKAGA